MDAVVVAVCLGPTHAFSKAPQLVVRLVAGHGVEGDAHAGATVKHRSRVARDPGQPNLRQVHLIAAETIEDLKHQARALDLFALPTGARLRLGESAVVEITGLRNPCTQLDRFQEGLMSATLGRDESGAVTFKAGIMGVVVEGGEVRPGDTIAVELPAAPHRRLERV